MKSQLLIALLLLAASSLSHAQTPSATPHRSESDGIPLEKIISTIASKTGKKIIVDPRVRAQVTLLGQEPAALSYADFLSLLETNNFTAVERGGYVRVIPIVDARMEPVPLVSGSETFPDALVVSKVIFVKSMPAVTLLPALRPLLPQWAHLSTISCKNVLVVIDRFANVKRLEAVIQAIDVGEPYKPEKCETKPESR